MQKKTKCFAAIAILRRFYFISCYRIWPGGHSFRIYSMFVALTAGSQNVAAPHTDNCDDPKINLKILGCTVSQPFIGIWLFCSCGPTSPHFVVLGLTIKSVFGYEKQWLLVLNGPRFRSKLSGHCVIAPRRFSDRNKYVCELPNEWPQHASNELCVTKIVEFLFQNNLRFALVLPKSKIEKYTELQNGHALFGRTWADRNLASFRSIPLKATHGTRAKMR